MYEQFVSYTVQPQATDCGFAERTIGKHVDADADRARTTTLTQTLTLTLSITLTLTLLRHSMIRSLNFAGSMMIVRGAAGSNLNGRCFVIFFVSIDRCIG